MSLFAGISPSQEAPAAAPGQGLFAGVLNKLHDPAVKAGLLQAGLSMLNANPGQSPFAQIFSGIGEGIGAHARYQDLVTQQEKDRQDALAEQQRKDQEFNLKQQVAQGRLKQIENAIQVSQENAHSLGTLRSAQAAKAGKGADGSKAFSGAWRAFYRNKMSSKLDGSAATPEEVRQWKQEFNSLEAASPGATPVKPGASLAPAPANDLLATAQQLADEEGISLEEALQAVKDAQSED